MGNGGAGKAHVHRVFVGLLALVVAVFITAAAPRPAAALDSEEMRFLDLINQYRAANGLGALTLNNTLNQTARWMAQDMAANNYFSHTDSQGRDPFVRMAAFGYTYNTWKGENLAAGVSGAQAAFDLWKGSPGHNANMLGANYTVIGIARAFDEKSTFGWYWTTEFGGQDDPPPPPAPAPEPPPPPPPPAPAPAPAPAPDPAPPAPEPTPPPAPAQTPGQPAAATDTVSGGAPDVATITGAAPVPTPAAPSPSRTALTAGSPPHWRQIAVWVEPWWRRLMVFGHEPSLLRVVSYLAEKYLTAGRQGLASGDGPPYEPTIWARLPVAAWPVKIF